MAKSKDETGKTYGRWTVLHRTKNNAFDHACWLCRCECGRQKVVTGLNLRAGVSRGCLSCGQRARLAKDGR